MKFVRKVGDRGQITIPKEIRELMELHDGDILEFDIVAVHPTKQQEIAKPEPRAHVDSRGVSA